MKQVDNMHDVYRYASQVLVWIGNVVSGTEKAFKWIAEHPKRAQEKADALRQMIRTKLDFMERWKQQGSLAPDVGNAINEIGNHIIPDDVMQPMHELLKRDYFQRVWMVQEIFFANKSIVESTVSAGTCL
jgi:hypothetical protein